jgi:hypothetical protein
MKTAEKQYVAEDTPIKDCLSGWYVKPAMVVMFLFT